MKGLNKVNRTAAVNADVLDPLSAFAKQEGKEKEDDFTVIEHNANNNNNHYNNNNETLSSPNLDRISKNKSNGDSANRPNSLTNTFQNGLNSLIRQASFPKPSSLSPMRGTESPTVASPPPKKVEYSPVRNQRGSVVQPDDFDEKIPFLSGESRIMSLIDASTHVISVGVITGTLFMTNYRIVFIPSKKENSINSPSIASWLNIPLGVIEKLEKEKRSKDANTSSTSSGNGIQIILYCKDCRQVRIVIRGTNSVNGDYELERAFSLMSAYAFPTDVRHLFAYAHNYSKRRIIDLKEEFARLGVTTKYSQLWRLSDINQHYKLCSSYPEQLVVPSELKDDELYAVAAFRSGQRIPSLTWCNRSTGATLWRSSQPKAGVSGACFQDEKFIDSVARSNSYNKHVYESQTSGQGNNSEPFLFIVDCRSRTSAMANRAAGAGYESQTNYPNTRLEFYNIPNIHAVRDSYKSLVSIILNPSATPSTDINFTKQIEDTQWLTNVRLILKASWDTATTILRGCPVLVHCSHGWDRTAQVCALAELMLDPYYRTIKGFIVLLEKEWLTFGHPFKIRCGHGNDKQTRQEEEISPIFLQFLDCCWQFLKQYHYHFEFNAAFLLTIADHIYSCRFANFLFSCEQQRKINDARKDAADLWAYLESNRHHFINPHYIEGNNDNHQQNSNNFFVPPLGQLLRGVSLWTDFFLRWSSVSSLPKLADDLQHYLTPNGYVTSPLCATSHLSSQEHLVRLFPVSETIDDELLPMATSHDYWNALIAKEKYLKQLYGNELFKIKSSSEILLKKILDATAGNDALSSLQEEIEQHIVKLNQETTDLSLIEQSQEEALKDSIITTEEQQSAAIAAVFSNNNDNSNDPDPGIADDGPGNENGNNGNSRSSTEEVNLTSKDLKEAESEVSEEVYTIYV